MLFILRVVLINLFIGVVLCWLDYTVRYCWFILFLFIDNSFVTCFVIYLLLWCLVFLFWWFVGILVWFCFERFCRPILVCFCYDFVCLVWLGLGLLGFVWYCRLFDLGVFLLFWFDLFWWLLLDVGCLLILVNAGNMVFGFGLGWFVAGLSWWVCFNLILLIYVDLVCFSYTFGLWFCLHGLLGWVDCFMVVVLVWLWLFD